MRLFASCIACQVELGHPSFEPFIAPYYDDRIAKIKCSRGHESAILLQSQKFEVLLESGANALSEGFTLEAAGSYSAALERFVEFAANVMLNHLGMPQPTYEAMFTEMSRQSERQSGSFLALHALVLEKAFVPNKDIAPFRNAVIHKGQIPNPEKAKEFCSNVYAEILRTLMPLKQKCEHSIQSVVMNDIVSRRSKLPKDTQVSTCAAAGILSLAHAEHEPTFQKAFDTYITGARVLRDSIPDMQAMHNVMFPSPS